MWYWQCLAIMLKLSCHRFHKLYRKIKKKQEKKKNVGRKNKINQIRKIYTWCNKYFLKIDPRSFFRCHILFLLPVLFKFHFIFGMIYWLLSDNHIHLSSIVLITVVNQTEMRYIYIAERNKVKKKNTISPQCTFYNFMF